MDDEIIGTNPEAREYLKIAVVCAMCQTKKKIGDYKWTLDSENTHIKQCCSN